jgi:hypothetical protein
VNTSEACYEGDHEYCTTGDAWFGRCECPCHEDAED